MRCPRCQAENPPELAACARCGAALADPFAPPRAPLRDPAAAPPPPAMSAEDEAVATIIPYKNSPALTAYYLGLFGSVTSCIPLLGLIMPAFALWLGIKGLKLVRRDPEVHGTAHAWIGVVGGSIGLLVGLLALALTALGLIAAASGPRR